MVNARVTLVPAAGPAEVPVFRQVISITWADDVSAEAKQGYRDALEGLRAIPELLA